MEYRTMLRLQKCLFINLYIYVLWIPVNSFFFFVKINHLSHLTKYLSGTVFTLLILIESARLYLGHFGNLSRGVPELAGFLMLTVLMQMPLVSFFLFNPYLMSTPLEITLHSMLWLITVAEVGFGYMALKQASHLAKNIYLTHQNVGSRRLWEENKL